MEAVTDSRKAISADIAAAIDMAQRRGETRFTQAACQQCHPGPDHRHIRSFRVNWTVDKSVAAP